MSRRLRLLASGTLVPALLLSGRASPLQPTALADSLAPAALEALYREAVVREGKVDGAVSRLSTRGFDPGRTVAERREALLAAADLEWRFGRAAAAGALAERAVALGPDPAASLLLGRLLESDGRLDEARRAYEASLGAGASPAVSGEIRLRLALLSTDARDIEGLVALARERDRAFRNRAAVVLASLDRPAEAAALYEVAGEAGASHREHLRVAQWAVRAGQSTAAKEHAWKAVLASSLTRDVRYALSVLVEAHELDGSWGELLTRVDGVPKAGPDFQDLRIDLLRRLRRPGEAIALVESGRAGAMTATHRRRLLRMYAEAGRPADMVAEYRRLMAAEPAETAWPRGLAEHHLENGERERAAAAWRDFTAANRDPAVLLEGARAMAQAGLGELAEAAAARCESLDAANAVRAAWFRFEHHLRRGLVADAEAELERIAARLSPADPGRTEIADAFERTRNPRRAVAVWEELSRAAGGLGLDERMRLAWLYDTVGRRDEALAVWRELWERDVPESRRRMVEDRLLLLAAELGALGDIAAGLEQRLAAGEAAPKESSLLVRIYTEAGDPAAAVEVIQEYHGRTGGGPPAEIASLREQARVYQTLGRHAPFLRVTERLLELDQVGRVDHLQALVLAHVEHGGRREAAALQRRLAELRDASPTAGDEFEAGVLAMAGLRGQAIDSYRRALARQPAAADNHLLLADLLRQDRRAPEGIAILQHLAEHAPTNDAFVVAIDGILNLRPGPDSPALRWAQRRVLGRLAGREDRHHLHELAAEVAEAAREPRVYLAALENSLVDAGPRRGAVLRELVSATEERAGFMSGAAPAPDPWLNLAFSRRLIALGEEMPPEVYLNLGRTFLRMGEPGEALEAFNLAMERGGRPTLVEDAADRFEAAGHGREAATLYERALAADSANAGVMAKLAQVRSRDGSASAAHGMYLRALLLLAGQQPLETEGNERRRTTPGDQGFTFVHRRHFWTLQAGLLFTLPGAGGSEPASSAAGALERATDLALAETLPRAAARPQAPLASFPRLNLLSQIVRRLALAEARHEDADRLDQRLLLHFGHDARLVADLAAQRDAWGRRESATRLRALGRTPAPAAASSATARFASRAPALPAGAAGFDLDALSSLSAAARAALAQRSHELAIDTALAAGDPELAVTVFRRWLTSRRSAMRTTADAAESPRTATAGSAVVTSPGGASDSLAHIAAVARRKLPRALHEGVAREIAALVDATPALARELIAASSGADLFRAGAERSGLHALEEAAGRPLFTPESLAAAVAALDSRQLASLDLDYVFSSLRPAERLPLMLRYLQAAPLLPYWYPLFGALGSVLATPLEPAGAERLSAALRDRFQRAARSPSGLRIYNGSWTGAGALALRSLHPGNRGLVSALDRLLMEAHPDALPGGLFSGAGGDAPPNVREIVDGALRELAQLDPAAPAPSALYRLRQYFASLAGGLPPGRREELSADLQQRARAGWTPTLFATALALRTAESAGSARAQIAWLQTVLARQPAFRPALEALPPLLAQTGDTAGEIAALESLAAAGVDAERHRARISALWRSLDHPVNALRAAGGRSRADPTSEPVAGVFGLRSPRMARDIASLAVEDPDPARARTALRGLLQLLTPSGSPPGLPYQLAQSGVPTIDPVSFVDLPLPASLPPTPEAATDRFRSNLLTWLESDRPEPGEPGRPLRLWDRLVTRPFVLPELEAAVRTLDPAATEADEQFQLVALLAGSIVRQGRLEAELARIGGLMAGGRADRREVLLWLELAGHATPAAAETLLPAAETALRAGGGAPSDYQRIQFARLLARAGRGETAAGIYAVSAVGALAGTGYRAIRGDRPSFFSALGLVNDAAANLPPADLGKLMETMARVARPPAGPAFEAWYQRFRFWLIERAALTGVPADSLGRLQEGLDTTTARREDLLRLLLARRVSGPTGDEPSLLREALRRGTELAGASTSDASVARYSRNLGFRLYNPAESQNAADPAALMQMKLLFPRVVTSPTAAKADLGATAAALLEWGAETGVDRDAIAQLLALLVVRGSQRGDPAAVVWARGLGPLVSGPERVTPATATLAAAAADQAGAPLDTAVLRHLVRTRGLAVPELATAVRRIAAAEGQPAALAAGETALDYTREDALLAVLEALAREVAEPPRAERYAKLRREAAAARAALAGNISPRG